MLQKGKLAAVLFLLSAPSAFAGFVPVNLSPYVNLGFQNPNSWFINGNEFTPILGLTTGNQGSSVPFLVADAVDTLGNGGNDNFWFGLYGGPGSTLFGAPLSITIPIGFDVSTVHTLADNTFGFAGNNEYSITLTPVTGAPVTFVYVGSDNTRDYNASCVTNGCDATPNAADWFVGLSGEQRLQEVAWTVPSGFGTLASITVTQIDTFDGAILAGITVEPVLVPEPATGILAAPLLAVGLWLIRRRNRAA
jgi:hypothetical protein